MAYARERERVLRICDAAGDPRTLRLELLEAIRRVVGFDAYAWLMTDPATSVGCAPLADVPCLPQLPQLIRLKYLTTINRWTMLRGNARMLAEATGGDLSRSPLWRDLLRHYAVADIASAVYRDRFGCWGFLDLWRVGPSGRFGEADAGFLDAIARPVTAALRRSLAGTFMGVGRRLRDHNREIKLISVQPDSPLHGVEGLKHMETAIRPGIYDPLLADEDVGISTERSHDLTRRLAQEEGILAGVSSGAALGACLDLAARIREGIIVTVFPDSGTRYLTEPFWEGRD